MSFSEKTKKFFFDMSHFCEEKNFSFLNFFEDTFRALYKILDKIAKIQIKLFMFVFLGNEMTPSGD
jgi:hypothetical protein